MVVAAYTTASGCILAASIEAKKLGIKTCMRVREGRALCPKLIVLPPDPPKYRRVHLQLYKLLLNYTNEVTPKSIDEFTLDLDGYPAFRRGMFATAQEIKQRIKQDLDWLTVSIGIASNRFLAKQAAGLQKPDGLTEINHQNFIEIYSRLELPDLNGINLCLATRLNSVGIYFPVDFYHAPISQLKAAFSSVAAYYWYLRLRGWEIDGTDFDRKSYSSMYSLPKKLTTAQELTPLLHKLTQKTGRRLRAGSFSARGVHLGLLYDNGDYWHRGLSLRQPLIDSRDLFFQAFRLLLRSPRLPVANLAFSCFDLTPLKVFQLSLFHKENQKPDLVQATDRINDRWGEYAIHPAAMLGIQNQVLDRIGFGNIKDLQF